MKYTNCILVGLCVLGLSIPALTQNLNRPSTAGIPGYLDPVTGTFKPMPQVTGTGAIPGTTPTTGTFVVNLTIVLRQNYPSTETYSCGASATTFDTASTLVFSDSNQVAATNTSGIVTCTVRVPYSWALTTPASDFVTVEYSIYGTNGASGTNGLPIRLANHGVDYIQVPTNGTVTHYNLTTYL